MPESLGEKLRQAREERGISISEVAEQTRISALYLEAIESDDYSTLPGGIFNKGFVKSFAKYVGVDEHEALQDYAKLMASQDSVEKVDEKSYRPEVLTDDNSGPSMLPTIIFAVVILGLMTWGILTLVNYLQNMESSSTDANIAQNNVKVDEDANTNVNSNTNNTAANEAMPSTDEVKVQIATTADELSLQARVDGKLETILLSPANNKEITFTGEESVNITYYKGLAESVQLTVNGKKIETPLPPANYRKNGLQYEINKSNIKQVLQDGKISFGGAEEAANSNTATQ